MTSKAKASKGQSDLFNIQEHLHTAPCVPALRDAVNNWRESNYRGATDTTLELLNYWFRTDHVLRTRLPFKYHLAQRESIETLIYVWEVEKVRSRKALLERYAYDSKNLRLPPYDDFARYSIKMATGSGKTKVMALAIAWQYFNAVKEGNDQYAKNFLIFAPNIIVFERLRSDFQGGHIFRTDPLYPKHFDIFWDMEFYMRGEMERASSSGALYLTNIQQFYNRSKRNDKSSEPELLTALLGQKPQSQKLEVTDFTERLVSREGNLMILNDEAHHTHDEDSEWNNIIRGLHKKKELSSQLDFSATPRYSKGGIFAWTIFDYPLKQAILDNVVKRPVKGISKAVEAKSSISSVKYAPFLTAAVERWREYNTQLESLKKNPLLFIMMNNTKEADEIGEWLRKKYPTEFSGDKTLVIHTDSDGEITKKDLDAARKVAREVDNETAGVNAIVSVLMLREGWDVQNVTVVVGLRPYTAKANILPEQTIGRGLRLMFRGGNTGYQERVDIIGNSAFLSFVEELEQIEGIKLDTFELGKEPLKIYTIEPDKKKISSDIEIPELSPALVRKKSLEEEISQIDVNEFKTNPLPLDENDSIKSFIYEGRDIITDEKLFERKYEIPEAQTAQEVIGYYATKIANDVKLPSQFAVLVPKIKEFFEIKAFGKNVNIEDPAVIKAMSSNLATYVVIKEFERILRDKVIEQKTPEIISEGRKLSTTIPYPFSKLLLESKKSIFNFVACDNEFEKSFAKFLNNAKDVKAFAKLPEQFGFCIEYTDTLTNLRNYYPDFVIKLDDNTHFLVETKGREDVDVKRKDEAAENWCKNASELTETKWKYLKVQQKEFDKLQPYNFEDLQRTLFSA